MSLEVMIEERSISQNRQKNLQHRFILILDITKVYLKSKNNASSVHTKTVYWRWINAISSINHFQVVATAAAEAVDAFILEGEPALFCLPCFPGGTKNPTNKYRHPLRILIPQCRRFPRNINI